MTDTPPAPPSLSEAAAEAWREVIAAHGPGADRIAGPLLEEYAQAVAVAREARGRVDREGLVVADAKGAAVAHPALAVEARALDTIRRLTPQVAPKAHRGDGYMARATSKALAAAPEVSDDERFAGAVAATRTLAWIIDMAQEDGREAMRRAAFGPIPSYLKALKDLGLTPVLRAVEEPGEAGEAGASAPVTSLDSWVSGRGA